MSISDLQILGNDAVTEFVKRLDASAEELFKQYLKKTVSLRDTFARRELKENFYHGILLGILSFKGDWYVTSNEETGDGIENVLKYGIACYKKRCRVALGAWITVCNEL